MSDFLAGLVARARDGAPGIARRRPSLFEPSSQPPGPVGDPRFRGPRALVPQEPGSDWDALTNPADETGAGAAHPADPVAARRRSPRRSTRPVGQPSWTSEPSSSSGDDGTGGRGEPADPAASPGARGQHTAGSPAVRPADRSAPPAPRALSALRASLVRTIETIVEKPAPVRAVAPVPQPVGPRTGVASSQDLRPAAMSVQRDNVSQTTPRTVRSQPGQVRSAPETASGELDGTAPVRSLRRERSAAAGAQAGAAGRRSVPTPPPPPVLPAIHVTIGRIEVRATPARTPAPAQAARPSGPKLGLDEYLRSRGGRGG